MVRKTPLPIVCCPYTLFLNTRDGYHELRLQCAPCHVLLCCILWNVAFLCLPTFFFKLWVEIRTNRFHMERMMLGTDASALPCCLSCSAARSWTTSGLRLDRVEFGGDCVAERTHDTTYDQLRNELFRCLRLVLWHLQRVAPRSGVDRELLLTIKSQ